MENEHVGVLFNYHTQYPNLASLDPTSIVRECVVEIGRIVTLIISNGVKDYQFGKGIMGAVAYEYSILDSDYIIDPRTATEILSESKKMVLEIMDMLRIHDRWYLCKLQLITAQYLKGESSENVGFLIRMEKPSEAYTINAVDDVDMSTYLLTATKILIGR